MLPIDWAPMRIFKRTADVNLWGLIEMTKTFLPLVKMARGRVVNFASVGGKLLACEQALLFGRVKRVSRERARGTFFTFCGVFVVEMKIYERSLQALLSSAPRSRVLARLASLAQIGELARRLVSYIRETNYAMFMAPQP